MRMLRRPERLEPALLQRAPEVAGWHRIVGEEHRGAEFHLCSFPPYIAALIDSPTICTIRSSVTSGVISGGAMQSESPLTGVPPPPRWRMIRPRFIASATTRPPSPLAGLRVA